MACIMCEYVHMQTPMHTYIWMKVHEKTGKTNFEKWTLDEVIVLWESTQISKKLWAYLGKTIKKQFIEIELNVLYSKTSV